MADTYSSKPFVSYDGLIDGKRAEVKVVKGYGHVNKIEPSTNGKSNKVSFAVDNTKWPSAGYSRDEKVMAIVRRAEETGEPIHFRIESRRKNEIDRAIPIMELTANADIARESVVKSLAAVKYADDEAWTISADAVTRLDEDPAPTGGPVSAYNNTPEELRAAQNEGGGRQVRPGDSFEAPPFQVRNSDGELNLGSVAIAAPLNIFSFILEWERENGIDVPREQRKILATTLLRAANQLQLAIYRKHGKQLATPDLTAGSHTRARALVFEAVRTYFPISDELYGDEDALKAWATSIVKLSLAMWEWAITEVKDVLGD